MTDLSVEDYSDRAIVVRGDTKPYKEDMKALGGEYNANLKGGPGWIFPKKIEDKVLSFVASGELEKKKDSPLLSQIEKELSTMSSQEKLNFLAKIVGMMTKGTISVPAKLSKPVAKTSSSEEEEDSPPKSIKKTTKKSDDEEEQPKSRSLKVVKPKPKVASKTLNQLDSDLDSDEEDMRPHKRLLA